MKKYVFLLYSSGIAEKLGRFTMEKNGIKPIILDNPEEGLLNDDLIKFHLNQFKGHFYKIMEITDKFENIQINEYNFGFFEYSEGYSQGRKIQKIGQVHFHFKSGNLLPLECISQSNSVLLKKYIKNGCEKIFKLHSDGSELPFRGIDILLR